MSLKTIIIAGGTGLIGAALSAALERKGGYNVRILSRFPENIKNADAYYWNPSENKIDEAVFAEADIIINLAGENIGAGRWTSARKKLLRESRIASNLIFKEHLKKSSSIHKYIAASAQGFYGDRGDTILYENDKPSGHGFQSQLTVEWEETIKKTVPENIDLCIMRNSVVMSTKGGALAKMMPTARLGIIPQFGRHYLSWIHIDDVAGIYLHCIENENFKGIVNINAGTATYREFAQAIKKGVNSKLPIVPTPAFLLKTALGQMSEMVLESTRMSSDKLRNLGYNFMYEDLDSAIADIIKNKK